MKSDDPNDVIPTAAQQREANRSDYEREILDEIEAAKNRMFAVAHRLRKSPYSDDGRADRAHNIAGAANDLRIDLGGRGMIDTTNDGGPASPTYVSTDSPEHPPEFDTFPGMSLRDWFAGQAVGHAASRARYELDKYGDKSAVDHAPDAAKLAYRIADAMLKAREES